jgi:thiol:disulfide interchange protein DsbD
MKFARLWCALLPLVWAPVSARADKPPRVPEGAVASASSDEVKPRVEARLLIDPAPGVSRPAHIGVLFTLDPGWHLYWLNPGEAGLPTKLAFHVDGADVGPVAWPAPEVLRDPESGLTSYGYTGQVLLASELRPSRVKTGARLARADADFLLCKDQCIPGKVSLARDLDAALAQDPKSGDAARTHALFERFAARVPVAASQLGVDVGLLAVAPGQKAGAPFRAQLAVNPCMGEFSEECGIESAAFIPATSHSIALEGSSSTPADSESGTLTLDVLGRQTDDVRARDARISGVLELRTRGGGTRFVALDLPLEPDPAPAPEGGLSLASALFFALVGGLILNLMPCVLPVLALKAFAIAELAGHSRREVASHALGYTAGILVTMLALAALVIALRAAGTYVGWGFQFQEPRFALALTALLVVFALNLFGVFEIGTPSGLANIGAETSGALRTFFDGLLAVVLATPCTAPFLGSAVGFAFAGSGVTIALIFLAIGVGLAVPLLLMAAFPSAVSLLPRSGPWMAKLRVALGFALLGSAIFTLWVFGQSAGLDALAAALALLCVLGVAAWIYGLHQLSDRGGRGLAIACALALAAFVGLQPFLRAAHANGDQRQAGASAQWQSFDRASIDQQLRAGRPVFVDFTAAWCLTCKVNERAVIGSARVQAELERRGFALFRADWTHRDETIRRELAHFGRAGVPLYVVYDPARPESPHVLSELLTIDGLMRALRLGDGSGA